MTLKGACKHVYYLLIEGGTGALVEVAYLFYIVQPLAIMCIAVSRTSVAVLVLRILGPRNLWRKWFLWFSIVSTLVLSTLTSIVIFAACKPVAALWYVIISFLQLSAPFADAPLNLTASTSLVSLDALLKSKRSTY